MDMAAEPWEPRNTDQQGQYPESLTAILPAEDEEYLAWLADICWPDDEYFELEAEWREETEAGFPPGEQNQPACPGCHRQAVDVWPCRCCGRLLHAACRTGLEHRPVARYRTEGMQGEEVIAEWICTGCSSVVGLDTEPT